MSAPTFKYVWVLSGKSLDGVKIYSKKDKLEEVLSDIGAKPLRKVQMGTTCWQYEVDGKKFKAVKQKVEDSHGL